MPTRIGIVAKTATVRRGLASLVGEAGYTTAEMEDLAAWRPGRGGSAVVYVLRDEEGHDQLALFVEEHRVVPVVAVVPTPDVVTVAAGIRLGAIGVVGEDDPAETLTTAVHAATRGLSVVSVDVLRAMAERVPAAPDPDLWVTDAEVEWLRSLADGATVPRLAEAAGYSEREMFRMLQRLYQRLGVVGRTGAIVWATRNGLI